MTVGFRTTATRRKRPPHGQARAAEEDLRGGQARAGVSRGARGPSELPGDGMWRIDEGLHTRPPRLSVAADDLFEPLGDAQREVALALFVERRLVEHVAGLHRVVGHDRPGAIGHHGPNRRREEPAKRP